MAEKRARSGLPGMTDQEIADRLGVTHQAVHQAEDSAIRKLWRKSVRPYWPEVVGELRRAHG